MMIRDQYYIYRCKNKTCKKLMTSACLLKNSKCEYCGKKMEFFYSEFRTTEGANKAAEDCNKVRIY